MIRKIYIGLSCLTFFVSCAEEASENYVETPDYGENSTSKQMLTEGLSENSELDLTIAQLELNPVQYVQWINDQEINSLTKKKEISEINFQLKHLPVEYMVSNELRKKEVSKAELDSLLPEYQGMEYYELRISVDDFNDETAKYGVADMAEYQQRIVYMSFAMQNDLSVTVNGDKEVACQLFHFERTYGVAPYATFLFGFSKEQMGDQVEERTVVFNDNLFNKGLVKFHWHTAEIENVPKIQVL